MQVDKQDSAILALIENIQRRDLHYLEEATAIAAYLRQSGSTQEEAAAFAAALNKLYTASKTESRAGFPHFRNTAGGETARGTTD